MGFFSDVVNNTVSSVKDVVAAPAATISKAIDTSPAMIAINPVNWFASNGIYQATGVTPTEQLAIGAAGGLVAGASGYTALSDQATMLSAQEAGFSAGTWYETLGLGPEGLGLLGEGGLLTALWPTSLAGAAATAGAAGEAYDKYAPKGSSGGGAGAKIGGAVGRKSGGNISLVLVGVGVLFAGFLLWKAIKK